MSFMLAFLLGPVFFRTALPCSGSYHMEKGGMALHDAVGQISSMWAKGCMLVIVCVTFLDMTTPPWWREKVMVYYY